MKKLAKRLAAGLAVGAVIICMSVPAFANSGCTHIGKTYRKDTEAHYTYQQHIGKDGKPCTITTKQWVIQIFCADCGLLSTVNQSMPKHSNSSC